MPASTRSAPRSRRALLAAAALALLAPPTFAADHHEEGEKSRRTNDPTRILFVTQSAGFKHGSVDRDKTPGELAPAEVAMRTLAGQHPELLEVEFTQDVARDFTRENLERFDAVAFYTTGKLPIPEATLKWFLDDWLKRPGKGFLGFHSATDTYKDDTAGYRSFINGSFGGHPWTAGTTVTLKAHDPAFPGVKSLVAADERPDGFTRKDEIYQYEHFDPKAVRVLASLDMAATDLKRPYHVPVIWVREWGGGKVYYNNLGHREDTWTDEAFVTAIADAVRWVRGDLEGDATPNPQVSEAWDKASKEAAGA